MEVEGMVHALEEIQRLLRPDGCLIDIHPIREAPLIRVYKGRNLLFAESDPGYDYDEDIRHAEEALDEIRQRGLFRIEGSAELDLVTHGSSVAEVRDYWAKYGAYDDSPKDNEVTALQDQVYARADEIMRTTGGETEIAYHERARITRLKPIVRE